MIQIITILYALFVSIKEGFEGHLKFLLCSFLWVTIGFFVLSKMATKFDFIPESVLSVLISVYMILTILFIVLYITIIFLQCCPTIKSKLKVLFKVIFFYLQILFMCFFIVVPPLFSNYIVFWLTGRFDLLKKVKFWIFILLEILIYELMVYFNLNMEIILSWIIACDGYLLFWIDKVKQKKHRKKRPISKRQMND